MRFPTTGSVELAVVGRLKTNLYFYGSDTIDVGDQSEAMISAAKTFRPTVDVS